MFQSFILSGNQSDLKRKDNVKLNKRRNYKKIERKTFVSMFNGTEKLLKGTYRCFF